jgi:hypothetical protein
MPSKIRSKHLSNMSLERYRCANLLGSFFVTLQSWRWVRRNFSREKVGYILWRICPLLGNGLINTFPIHTLSAIEGHPLLGSGPINTHSSQQKTVISVRSVPRNYKRAQSIIVRFRIEGVQRSSVRSQNSSSGVSSRKKVTVSDSDLWTDVTSCIKVQ